MVDKKALEQLGAAPLMRGLPPADLERAATIWQSRVYPADAVLMSQDTPGETLYLVLEGAIKIYVLAPDGGEVVLGLRGVNETIGEVALIDNGQRSATVSTLESCRLLWTPRADFVAMMREIPTLCENVACILAARLRLATAQIHALCGLGVRGRLASQLVQLAAGLGKDGGDGAVLLPIRINQTDLARMTGTTRVSINQVMADWKRREIVVLDDKARICIPDLEVLRAEIY